MERFAKRKVLILTGKNGNSLAWFCPDHGEKLYMGAYNSAMSSDAICEAVKRELKSVRNRKYLYEISADCLVDFCMLHWYVKAENEEEAWNKGYEIVNTTNIADSGSVDCKRIEHLPQGARLYKEGVRPLAKEIYADTDSAST